MRLPSAGGAGGGACCCRYAVPGALFFCVQRILSVCVGQKTMAGAMAWGGGGDNCPF